MKQKELKLQCPLCKGQNDLVSGSDERDFSDMKDNPRVIIVLLCFQCCGAFFYKGGVASVITTEEWLELPAEYRSDIKRRAKALAQIKKRFEQM